MNATIFLIIISLCLGAAGLGAFFWSLKHTQYDDLDGSAERIFLDEHDRPLNPRH